MKPPWIGLFEAEYVSHFVPRISADFERLLKISLLP
jgi:hypothetical protein